MSDGDGAVEIRKTLGQSHRDLHRILPRVLRDLTFEAKGAGYRAESGTRKLDIAFGDESVHQIALLKMPQTSVRFRFDGWNGSEINDFMERFHRAFQKGGG
ncbi:MAG: hypothetical protein HKO62_08815 [Gammaproteobacteria bacterium]|nr:hypothetical protein [Gammaproteobacteria bacterium]